MDEHVFGLLPAYALGCLEEEEAEKVIEHLDRCALCRAELMTYQSVTDQLGLAAPSAEPPVGLKQKVLERAQPPDKVTHPKRAWQHILKTFNPLSLSLRIVGVFVFLALFTSNLFLWLEVRELRATVPPNFHMVNLAGTDAAPGATGVIVVSPDGRHGTLVVSDLPWLDADYQYQLWLIQDEQRTSGGIFSVSEDGYGSLWVNSPEPLLNYPGFGITIEPAGGSPGPTGDRVLGGEL